MEFKVGDWVICHNKHLRRIIKSDGKTIVFSKQEVIPVDSEFYKHVKPWQPKVGEWCWLNNNNHLQKSFPSLRLIKYHKTFLPDFNNGIIEPFIGTLPSFLKDK